MHLLDHLSGKCWRNVNVHFSRMTVANHPEEIKAARMPKDHYLVLLVGEVDESDFGLPTKPLMGAHQL